MVNNFAEGFDVDEFFPKGCKEGGPLSQTPSEATGCWQSSPVSCCWGRTFLLCKHHQWLAPALTTLVSRGAQLFLSGGPENGITAASTGSFKAYYTQAWLLSSSLEITFKRRKDESQCK